MAIKLYNKTRCPDEILRPLITAAGQRIGARTGCVVKVMQPRMGSQGKAMPSWGTYEWHLTRKKIKDGGRLIKTDKGWIELHVPRPHKCSDPLLQAERFYRLCLHEWAHIKDFQDDSSTNPKIFAAYNRNWANRPHERRACCMTTEALEKPLSKTAEEAILALAEWLEQNS